MFASENSRSVGSFYAVRNIRLAVTAACCCLLLIMASCRGVEAASRPAPRRLPPSPRPPRLSSLRAPPSPSPSPPPVGLLTKLAGPEGINISVDSSVSSTVRVLVNVTGGKTAWAPLCAPDALNETLQRTLAYVACNQYYAWPNTGSSFGWIETPLLISGGAIDASKVTHWATVTGWGSRAQPDTRYVQELSLRISTTPCKQGRLMAVFCSYRRGPF